MNRRWGARLPPGSRRVIGCLVSLVALPVSAQIGPLTDQNLFFDQAASARAPNYLEADAGLIYSDNITRVPDGHGDTMAILGLLGDLTRNGPRFDFRVASDLALVKYLPSDYPTQPLGYFDGSGEFWLAPGVLAWTGRDTYTQTVLDPFAPVTPDNLESINYATTGPRLTLRPTLRTTLTVDGTYSYINGSSKSPLYVDIDDHRYAGDVTLSHAFTGTVSGYVTGSAEKVDFVDQVDNTNFTDHQGLVGFKVGNARTTLDAAAGYTWYRVGDQKPTGSTWHVELARQLSPSQRLAVHALQQVTDAANLFRLNLDAPVASTAAYSLTNSQPFTDREYGADYRVLAARTSLELAFLDIREQYKLTPSSNRDVQDATAFLTRTLNMSLKWDIGAEYEHQNYINTAGGSSNTINAITDVRWQLARRLGLRFLYAHSSLSPHGYGENQLGITVNYALIEAGPANASADQPAAPPPLTPGTVPGAPIHPQ
jgi:hypothetical protein